VLDSQSNTSAQIQSWASHIATVTGSLQTHDRAVAGFIDGGGPAADAARQLVDRLQPTLPILLANLVSVGQVALTYQPDIEQLLVLFPQVISATQAGLVANMNTKQAYHGQYLSFNLNLNLPPPCTTGFLPAQQRRVPNLVDYPNRPAGDLYCRVPQDSQYNVRAVRNTPCETVPGKRAPSVALCESNEQFVPLNDGNNWKGDPNATLSGQGIPQLPPAAAPPPGSGAPPPPPGPPVAAPAVATAEYDPATGTYVGPDGQQYTQSDLAHSAPKDKSLQSMLLPPGS
jgi:phospholipid/cholesterol/gamma-HCH transport system substrate-binding protein